MHQELEYLLRRRKEKVVYVPNPGNAGDSFITHSSYQFLDRLGLKYDIGSHSQVYPGSIVVYGGGGNLVPLYNEAICFIKRNFGTCRELIVLPHTIRGYGETFGKLGQNTHIFCREQPSYDYVRNHAAGANVYLSHDMAFACDFDETRRQIRKRILPDAIKFLFHIRSNTRKARNERDLQRKIWNNGDVLNAFRTDIHEMTALKLPDDNFDVSDVFSVWDTSPLKSLKATYRMLQLISRFRAVNTNRLHVAIMSALLGLEVHFYDNSYGKNRDVFAHSLQRRFPTVHWHQTAT